MQRLKIEDGILIKQYSRPFKDGQFAAPPAGWTPDDGGQWVEDRVYQLQAERKKNREIPSWFFAIRQAAVEQGRVFREKRQPWPGWVPVGLGQHDRKIRKAYREYFVELNKDSVTRDKNNSSVEQIQQALRPPDGFYDLKNGKFVPAKTLDPDSQK